MRICAPIPPPWFRQCILVAPANPGAVKPSRTDGDGAISAPPDRCAVNRLPFADYLRLLNLLAPSWAQALRQEALLEALAIAALAAPPPPSDPQPPCDPAAPAIGDAPSTTPAPVHAPPPRQAPPYAPMRFTPAGALVDILF